MAHAMAQVRLRRANNLPEDVIINTFHFSTAGATVTQADAQAIVTALTSFYTLPAAGSPNTLGAQYLSDLVSQTGHEIRVYDMGDPPPRVPRVTASWNFTAAMRTTNRMPAEVALVMSFSAASASGGSPRRRKGRVYLGPLAPSFTAVSGDIRPDQGMREQIANIAVAHLINGAGVTWCVWSEVDAALRPVVSVQIDDSFDTQRRRGIGPTTKTIRP